MSRKFNGAIAVAIAMCLLCSACDIRSDVIGENTPEEIEAMNHVVDQINLALRDAYTTSLEFEGGALDGGYAVLLVKGNDKPINAAFWTQGETVYAVNDAARALNPALANAPEAITEERVRAVVD